MADDSKQNAIQENNLCQEQAQARLEVESLIWPALYDFTNEELLAFVTQEMDKFGVEKFERSNPLPELGDLSDTLGPIPDEAYGIKGFDDSDCHLNILEISDMKKHLNEIEENNGAIPIEESANSIIKTALQRKIEKTPQDCDKSKSVESVFSASDRNLLSPIMPPKQHTTPTVDYKSCIILEVNNALKQLQQKLTDATATGCPIPVGKRIVYNKHIEAIVKPCCRIELNLSKNYLEVFSEYTKEQATTHNQWALQTNSMAPDLHHQKTLNKHFKENKQFYLPVLSLTPVSAAQQSVSSCLPDASLSYPAPGLSEKQKFPTIEQQIKRRPPLSQTPIPIQQNSLSSEPSRKRSAASMNLPTPSSVDYHLGQLNFGLPNLHWPYQENGTKMQQNRENKFTPMLPPSEFHTSSLQRNVSFDCSGTPSQVSFQLVKDKGIVSTSPNCSDNTKLSVNPHLKNFLRNRIKSKRLLALEKLHAKADSRLCDQQKQHQIQQNDTAAGLQQHINLEQSQFMYQDEARSSSRLTGPYLAHIPTRHQLQQTDIKQKEKRFYSHNQKARSFKPRRYQQQLNQQRQQIQQQQQYQQHQQFNRLRRLDVEPYTAMHYQTAEKHQSKNASMVEESAYSYLLPTPSVNCATNSGAGRSDFVPYFLPSEASQQPDMTLDNGYHRQSSVQLQNHNVAATSASSLPPFADIYLASRQSRRPTVHSNSEASAQFENNNIDNFRK